MATKTAAKASPEDVQTALKVLESTGYRHTYIYREIEEELPVALRSPTETEGYIPVNIIGQGELTRTDRTKVNALLRKNWPTLEYTRGDLTFKVVPGYDWSEA
jgi:hypothetical protein